MLTLLAVLLLTSAPMETLPVDLGAGVTLELVRVPSGTFVQGSPPSEPGRGTDEGERTVTLTRDFYVGRTPVTRGQFARFVAATGYRTEAEKGTSGGHGLVDGALVQRPEFNWKNPGFAQDDGHPVVLVTFADAVAFSEWMTRISGRAVRLPTEAEWEWAARAACTRPCLPPKRMEAELDRIAWHRRNSGDGTRAVGQKSPNAWGLLDTSGNVHEWVRDFYGPYATGSVTDPEVTAAPAGDTARRGLRGGSFLREPAKCRPAARYRNTPGSRNADNGFRVVASVEVAAPPAAPAAAQGLAQPSVPEPAGPGGAGGYVLGFGALLGVLAVWIRRRSRRGRVKAKPADDGFWIEAPQGAVGSVVSYRASVGGQWRTGLVTLEALRQFVYTGDRPAAVEVTSTRAPEQTDSEPDRYAREHHVYRSDHHRNDYPSAY